MDDSTAMRKKFEELAESLASVDDANVLGVLVDAREAGLVSKGLDEQINRLRDELTTPADVVAWARDVADGGDEFAFRAAEEASDPSSVELEMEEADEDVDFAVVGGGRNLMPDAPGVSGESQTKDESEADAQAEPEIADSGDEAAHLDVADSEPVLELPIVEESEGDDADEDADMFDDIGDIMAEAGQKAIDEAPGFKLPKLTAPKKLSGDARKKLSKKFSLPKPTSEVPAVPKPKLPSISSNEGNETPIAGLDAIRGLVANAKKDGAVPTSEDAETHEPSGASSPGFDLDDLGLDDIVEKAADEAISAEFERADAATPVEPESEEIELEDLGLDDGAEEEPPLELDLADDAEADADEFDFGFGDDAGDDPGTARAKDEPEERVEDEAGDDVFGLDFGDLADEEGDDGDEASSPPRESGGFGAGPGMGSLFDDDELAEIQAAGEDKKPSRTTTGSSPGVRYDSGNSGARYAGKAPPPPTHRLGSGTAASDHAMTGFQVESEAEDDDFDLDFGFGGGSQSNDPFGAGASLDEPTPPAEESEDDFDFDLGLSNPEDKVSSPPGVPLGSDSSAAEDDEFDFDLGFENPAEKVESPGAGPKGYSEADFDLEFDDLVDQGPVGNELSGSVTKGPPGIEEKPGASTEEREDYDELRRQAVRSDVLPGAAQPREHQPTPMRHESVQRPQRSIQPTPMATDRIGGAADIGDDEFEDLAGPFDDEPRGRYRGEPLLSDESSEELLELPQADVGDNPFAHEAPTGVRHAAVESSFVLEEVSSADDSSSTNLAAILLEARRLYENGEFEQSMSIVQKVISREESTEALELKQAIEGELERHELDKLGSLAKVPTLKISMAEIPNLDLDHRAGFLLSQIDGMMAFEDLLELSAMSRFETLTVLTDLVEKGVIGTD